ncbi:MAG: pirin family protein [Coriobacteriia bacterium]|nr:pirin family protein [Coriobacteriia bacterium]
MTRIVREAFRSTPTLEGAGVRLHRAFGFGRERLFDPFLLFDDFRGDDPSDYSAGFPWHPHRGIETITYLIDGEVEHGDSLGNAGRIGPGEVQWMTAGSGVIHQEMPEGDATGRMGGFQLWANLPASHKMMDPRYRSIEAAEVPVAETDEARVRVVAGRVGEVVGPVTDVVIDPEYLDVTVHPGRTWTYPTLRGHTVFAYLFEGEACFGPSGGAETVCADDGVVLLLGDGDEVSVTAGAEGARFLLVSGRPLGEPIAWRGPIVMNTREELESAFSEYHAGTFVK